MGLFDFFKTKEPAPAQTVEDPIEVNLNEGEQIPDVASDIVQSEDVNDQEQVIEEPTYTAPEIPEHIFVEYEEPKPKTMETPEIKQEVNDINTLYKFLEQNLEQKGYQDALTNPDTSYMEEHIQYLHNDLNLMISKVETYYKRHLRDINFHIDTRKRNGMIETVDELLSTKETVEDEMKTVDVIKADAAKKTGLSQNLFLSYRRGFRNGFAAITYNTILGKHATN